MPKQEEKAKGHDSHYNSTWLNNWYQIRLLLEDQLIQHNLLVLKNLMHVTSFLDVLVISCDYEHGIQR